MTNLRSGVEQLMRMGGIRITAILSAPLVSMLTATPIAATADFVSRHLLTLGADQDRDIYVYAGSIGLEVPVQLTKKHRLLHQRDLSVLASKKFMI